MGEIGNRNDWIFGNINNSILEDKNELIKMSVIQMLNKSTKIFKYNNLPDTIKIKDIEILLQVGGYAIFKEVNGKLYAFRGGLGGQPNPYYLPTVATVANPALNYNANLIIGKECVVMLNDNLYQGLMPLFNKYSNLLAESEISLKYAIINARVPALVQADNDNTKASAEEFFNKIFNGKGYGIIGSKEFFEGIKSHDFYKEPHIKDLIESIQYIKGSWYNEIGLNAAFNMKREAINEAEATINEDILYPTIDTMLQCRKDGLEEVNKMFGTNITVDLDSIWKVNNEKDDLNVELLEAEIDSKENTEEQEENQQNEND